MLISELMVALGVALLLTATFTASLRFSGPWTNWLIFLAVILLAAWAGGMWIRPDSWPAFRVYWMAFLFVGLVAVLLLAATFRPEGTRPRASAAAGIVGGDWDDLQRLLLGPGGRTRGRHSARQCLVQGAGQRCDQIVWSGDRAPHSSARVVSTARH